jgi:act minimal PKS chain-length factor (CLF/KS beta)
VSKPRAVITGIGAISPNGSGTDFHWKATLSGRSGIAELTRFDATGYPAMLAGEVLDFDVAEHIPGRLLPQTDISTRFALAAAEWAQLDAGLDSTRLRDYDMGVVTANACGGFDFTHREFDKLWGRGPEYVSVYESFAWFYAVNTGQISIRHGMRGPGTALVGEQAGGLDALGHARRTVLRGTPVVVSGGVDSALDSWGYLAQLSGGRVTRATDAERAYLPFDRQASGYVPGEGGAILLVEDADAARVRGAAQVYGTIAGYAATFDPPPDSPRPPGLARAAEQALADAGLRPADIDVVFADAAGVPELDRIEAAAISQIFGAHGVPVVAPKALIGRLYSGGAPLDVVDALLSMRDEVIPGAPAAIDVPAEYELDLVIGEPRSQPVRTALVLARGRHGFNAALVLTAN